VASIAVKFDFKIFFLSIYIEWIGYGIEEKNQKEKEDWTKHEIKKTIGMKEKSPYSRTYLNVKNTTLYKLIKYYRYLLDFVQQKYFNLLFEFSNAENVLLMECVLFSKPFPQFQHSVEAKAAVNEKYADKNAADDQEVVRDNEWRSAIKEIIEDKDTNKHMHTCLSSIKEDLAEVYSTIKGHSIRGVPLDALIVYFKGESQFFYRKLSLILNQAYKEVLENQDVANLIHVGEELKKVYLPSKINQSLGLRFLDFLHMARSEISDTDCMKEKYTNYSEFDQFYQHCRRKKKDEANTRLQVVCSFFQYQIQKSFFQSEKNKWKKTEQKDQEDSDLVIKDIKSSSTNIFGTPKHVLNLNFFNSLVLTQELEPNARNYLGLFIKKKDAQLREYFVYRSRRSLFTYDDYFRTLFLKTDFCNQIDTLTLFIQLWQRKEPFMAVPAYYQKQIEEIKDIVLKNVDIERAKIRKVNLGKPVLEIPRKYDYLFFKPDKEKDAQISKRTHQEDHQNAETELNLVYSTAEVTIFLL